VFSRRTPEALEPNELTRAAESRRRAGLPLIDLTNSNPTAAGLEYPGDQILAALSDRRALAYEPAPRGWIGAREAIARHHFAQGWPADPERIILAGSTSELYGWLFKLLCDPGDLVAVPRPSYPLFECLARLEGVQVEHYRLEEALEWSPDPVSLDRLRARVLVLVNPNNPTGTFLKRRDWRRLQEFCARRGMALISDEVFYDYAWAPDGARCSSLLGPHEALTFTLSGLSKAAGLPQMKLGWVHVNGPAEQVRDTLTRLEWIADSYLPVSAPVQYAAPKWLELAAGIRSQILGRVLGNRGCLPFEAPAEGGWCSVLDLPKIRSEQDWVLELLRAGVLAQPGYFFDFEREAFLVANLVAGSAEIRQAAKVIYERV